MSSTIFENTLFLPVNVTKLFKYSHERFKFVYIRPPNNYKEKHTPVMIYCFSAATIQHLIDVYCFLDTYNISEYSHLFLIIRLNE